MIAARLSLLAVRELAESLLSRGRGKGLWRIFDEGAKTPTPCRSQIPGALPLVATMNPFDETLALFAIL